MYRLMIVRNLETSLLDVEGLIEGCEERFAVAYMNPQDAEREGLSNGSLVAISSSCGRSVVVKLILDEGVPPGYIVMPLSIWSMYLVDSENPIAIPVIEVSVRSAPAARPTKPEEIIDTISLLPL